ncbi:hypothetical protein [Glaciibacter sp. 2TAF33]|uniref:hypothetical protein n=1 Tax=Glaciibacter sp. 2TAF33 TaxID=3233015 RepID=UPI003F8DECD1
MSGAHAASSGQDSVSTPAVGPGDDRDRFAYDQLTARFLAHDQMLWQTPALALTAQAFLMTIALGPQVSAWKGAIASVLGLMVTVMSMHLLARHRFLELVEKAKLIELEGRLGIEPLSVQSWAWKYATPPPLGTAYAREGYVLESPKYTWLMSKPSYNIWQGGLLLFAAANVVILIESINRWLTGG